MYTPYSIFTLQLHLSKVGGKEKATKYKSSCSDSLFFPIVPCKLNLAQHSLSCVSMNISWAVAGARGNGYECGF